MVYKAYPDHENDIIDSFLTKHFMRNSNDPDLACNLKLIRKKYMSLVALAAKGKTVQRTNKRPQNTINFLQRSNWQLVNRPSSLNFITCFNASPNTVV